MSIFSQNLVAMYNLDLLVLIKTVNMYLFVVFNSGHDGYARGGSEYVLIRVPIILFP